MNPQTKQIIAGILVTIGIFAAGFGIGYYRCADSYANEVNLECKDYCIKPYLPEDDYNISEVVNLDPILR